MIYPIQSLRGIFAFLIFLSHYKFGTNAILPLGGDFGVSFFLILSGFILFRNYQSRSNISTKLFISSRFEKIYPLHLLTFFIGIYLYVQYNPIINIPNILLLQSWIPIKEFYFSPNPVSWYLSTLMLSYWLFPSLIKLFARGRKFVNIAAFSIFIYAILIIILPTTRFYPQLSYNVITYWTYIFPPVRLCDFMLGMLLAYFCNKYSLSINKHIATHSHIYALILITIVMSVSLLYEYIPQCIGSACWWWIPVSLLIVYCSFDTKSLITKLLNNKILIKSGEISFSFFMLHRLIIIATNTLLLKYSISIPPIAQFIITTIIALTAAFICEKYFVEKCSKFLKTVRTNKHSS